MRDSLVIQFFLRFGPSLAVQRVIREACLSRPKTKFKDGVCGKALVKSHGTRKAEVAIHKQHSDGLFVRDPLTSFRKTILSTHMGAYFGGAMVPHSLHFLRFSSAIHAWMYGLSWYPRLSTWKASSRMIVGSVCTGFRQYQRRRSKSHSQCWAYK